MTRSSLNIIIAGNPNCGKTTLFNALTGARQRVGNWPGVTVDRKTGRYHDGGPVHVVDLPGVYTLGALPGMESLDERIAQDAILQGDAQVLVNVVDATNLERNLYLTAQLLEMNIPMVVAVNMMDLSRKQGIAVDVKHLAEHLGCRVVPLVASRKGGIDELKTAIRETAAERRAPSARIGYGQLLEKAIRDITPLIADAASTHAVPPRWLAVKLLEGDAAAAAMAGPVVIPDLTHVAAVVADELGEDIDILIADARYAFANGLAHHVVKKTGAMRRSSSDILDKIVLNRWFGLPIFLGVMYLMFMFTINLGGVFVDFFDIAAKTVFVDGVGTILTALGSPDWLRVVLADGFGGGIQVVATFIPIIGFLYLFLSVLEDTGYMARAAFLMDRYMRLIGLPGKAFVPLIVGFGCNVPAIMATRTLEQQRDRIMSVMMTPFMSCGARLAVYALFTAAFFPVGGQNVVFGLYIIGIAVAIGTGFLLKHTLLKGETTAFVMELPPYHAPNPKGIALQAWSRLKSFIFGAGKIIVVVVAMMSFLNSLSPNGTFGHEDSDRSVLSAVGRAIVPVFGPLGIKDDNWPATVGVFTGVFAKEAVVGTLSALYSSLGKAENVAGAATADHEGNAPYDLFAGLGAAISTIPRNFAALGDLVTDPLGIGAAGVDSVQGAAKANGVSLDTFGAMVSRFDGAAGAMAYMLLILLYIPCAAALGAINREVGGRWTVFSSAWTLGIAYGVSVGFYQAATFTRHPQSSSVWIGGLVLGLAAVIAIMRIVGQRRDPKIRILAAE
ncbi:Fe(2+) transporter permease subunit FeoB [Varunaivibrio sulfuroxidans]|uniref:Ferrous iron transport protein B n=1 Tax=Varunaivibrio sulfuroxidans TaxID=1773489 RepID=A0A4R3JE64_9PROT|nr:Fe(2+) transporter permease subunit FeoB [Varunaivibrio sulfuroxidans]TCS64348.1 ferrous iron transport protein B [Varunaivibrio sulfuroxidans]WES31215.1 Fe(2+) transporter permease subunit FeoB [Varunaivibrio sulfuroxidans]